MNNALCVLACGAAFASGMMGARLFLSYRLARLSRRLVSAVVQGSATESEEEFQSGGWHLSMLRQLVNLSRQIDAQNISGSPVARILFGRAARIWKQEQGMCDCFKRVTSDGVCEYRLRLALIGALVGLVMSTALGFGTIALCVAGAVAGARIPVLVLKTETNARQMAVERELPEMLAIVSLGLRSGLTFDRSFALYAAHFDTPFSRLCESTMQRWMLGLEPRDSALRSLAQAYQSPLLTQSIESIVRALRFGSSLAENLDVIAREARAQYKASRQEAIAQAPTKMMIPTGALILPAMLLLVLGPVLLEMVNGF